MTFTYKIASGEMLQDGEHFATGYSGLGEAKNDPAMCDIHGRGPIPIGDYMIGIVKNDPETGPYSITLIPNANNEMHERSAFLIHGDSISHPGQASHGCIILRRDYREKIMASGDRYLQVIHG